MYFKHFGFKILFVILFGILLELIYIYNLKGGGTSLYFQGEIFFINYAFCNLTNIFNSLFQYFKNIANLAYTRNKYYVILKSTTHC